MGQRDDIMIVPSSDGLMFILIRDSSRGGYNINWKVAWYSITYFLQPVSCQVNSEAILRSQNKQQQKREKNTYILKIMSSTTLKDLPNEIIAKVLRYLETRDLFFFGHLST